MSEYGFKKLSIYNWNQPDPIMSHFVSMDGFRQPNQLSDADWAKAILEPEIGQFVPDEIRSLFEVARGSMVYGYFFYPLFTLSAEQLFRVAEAAIIHKCNELNAPKSKKTFQARINWLLEYGAIDKAYGMKWDAVRKLRNDTSHPSKQMILTPGNAFNILLSTTDHINALFNKTNYSLNNRDREKL